jgi:plasmid maintenance system antidote protein VapI
MGRTPGMTPQELRQRIEANDSSAVLLARSLDVTRATIYNWLKGTHPIDRATAIAIRKVLPRK